MKKFIIILTLIPLTFLFGLDMPKINKTLSGLTSNKSLTYFIASDNIVLSGGLNFASKKKADILVFSKSTDKNKMLIVNSYKALKQNPNSIGAIYVKKGRTQIVFVKERLDKNNLTLQKHLRKHLIHDWQLNRVDLLNKIQ